MPHADKGAPAMSLYERYCSQPEKGCGVAVLLMLAAWALVGVAAWLTVILL